MTHFDPLGDGKSRIELISHIGSDLDVANDARASFDRVSIELDDKDIKLIRYLIEHHHTSPFRGVVFKFKVKAPLYLARQWWKHVIASSHNDEQIGWNEKCISGNQSIRLWHGRTKTVRELFELAQKSKKKLPYVRSVLPNGEIVKNKIADVWLSGHRKVYRVTSALGFQITTTDNHKFLTPDGYKELRELQPGSLVMMNGIPAYQDRTWLEQRYVTERLVIDEIAKLAGCSYHTIRKWIRVHKLHVSRKEVSSRSIDRHGVFGKGETKTTNPKLAERASKLSAVKKGKPCYAAGAQHHSFKGDDATINAGHYRARKTVDERVCQICGSSQAIEIHHKDKNPLNNDPSNLAVVCQSHHKMFHGQEVLLVAHPVEITSIEELPPEDVFDIQMEGESNLVVNQFVVHNSFRYVPIEDSDDFYIPATFRAQSKTNRQASSGEISEDNNAIALTIYRSQCEASYAAYQNLLKLGVGREQARGVLVPSVYTSWVWTVSLQAVLHFIGLRKGEGAQKEIGAYAGAIATLIEPIVPHTIEAFWDVNQERYK